MPSVAHASGDASYSLYLIHYPLLSILAKVSGSLPPEAAFVLMVLLSVFSALLVHWIIERPIMRFLQASNSTEGSQMVSEPSVPRARDVPIK
jgi:exopolysaccharide production protein ExoZ